MPYAEKLRGKYRFLIYEYPHHTTSPEEQINFAANLLKKLSIEKVVLIGASDGGVYAQIFAKRRSELVQAMILTTTLTVDSDYIREIQKERFSTPLLLHSAIPPVSLVLMVPSVLVLYRWTALRDIPTTAPISPSVSSRTQCSIKMLCPGWGKLAKAAATSPSLI